MNHSEAAQVLAVMAAPYPWDVDDDQAEVWYQAALQRCDFDLGLEIAMRIVETEERFPAPARFNKERQLVERLRYAAEHEEKVQQQLASMPPTTGQVAEENRRRFIGEMRRMAARGAVLADKHNHRGPLACPVCGGMDDAALARLTPEQQIEQTAAARARSDARRMNREVPEWATYEGVMASRRAS
jgi:hypothetical protein